MGEEEPLAVELYSVRDADVAHGPARAGRIDRLHHRVVRADAQMQDQQQKQGYDAKVKAWLEKPEQAELVKSLKATISPDMKPEQQAQTLVNQAKNYIRNTGIKIS